MKMKKGVIKTVDFLFIYEVRNREIDSICLLGAYLESKGYSIQYVNSWDSLYHWHEQYRAKVLVLSAAYDDGTYDYFTSHAAAFKKAVNLQWEQVLANNIVFSTGKNSWDFSGIGLKTRHICWGQENRRYLHDRYGVDYSCLKVCGYIPLDFYRDEFRKTEIGRDRLFKKYDLDPKKKTILFISSFTSVGLPESELAIGTDEKKKAENRLQSESQMIILNWMEKFLEKCPQYQVVYRPHPAEADNPLIIEKAGKLKGLHFVSQDSVRAWIMNCDILCNWVSTAMIELYMSGKKTLLLRPVTVPFMFEMPIFKEGRFQAITTYEEFEQAILADQKDYPFPVEKDDLFNFYDVSDTPVYQRIGDYLIRTLNDRNYRSPDRNKRLSNTTKKYRILKMQAVTVAAEILYAIMNKLTRSGIKMGKLGDWIENRYVHYSYYKQKMLQNRISGIELRKKINKYKKVINKNESV